MRRLLLSLAVATALAAAVSAGLSGLTVGFAAPAAAHGGLVEADPGPGEPAPVGLTTVTLTFAELETDEPVTVTVTDEGGTDRVRGVSRDGVGIVLVAVDPLARGVHLVNYVVTPKDGHATKGGYYLEVVGAGEKATRTEEQGRTVAVAVGVTTVVGALVAGLLALRRRRPEAGPDEQPDTGSHRAADADVVPDPAADPVADPGPPGAP